MHRMLMWSGVGYALSDGPVALGAEERVVEAFDWAVVFLIVMPYAILLGVAGWIGYHYMRARQKRLARERDSGLQIVKKGEPRG